MTSEKLRKLSIALLDDDEGINEQGWYILRDMLVEDGQHDILEAVDSVDNRFFLKNNFYQQ